MLDRFDDFFKGEKLIHWYDSCFYRKEKEDKAQPLDQNLFHLNHPLFNHIRGVKFKQIFFINPSDLYVYLMLQPRRINLKSLQHGHYFAFNM